MNKVRYIGDVHVKFEKYLALTQGCDTSIQVGDFGAGFAPLPVVGIEHRFIRGNHDDPRICQTSPNWIPDGHQEDGKFFVGGAFSIDRDQRTIGRDWWEDEELGYEAMDKIIDAYEAAKPTIMITHDCPHEIGSQIFGRDSAKSGRNKTNMGLRNMWEIHKPALWLFGHWHQSERQTISGCEFICLAELEYIDL